MCETRDLVKKWPYWHTLVCNDETKIDMRYVCPRDVKKDAVAEGPVSVLEEVGSKARTGRAERGSMDGSSSSFLAKESEGRLDRKALQCGQKDLPGRSMDAKGTFRYWLVGYHSMSGFPDGGRHREAQVLLLSRMARDQEGHSRGPSESGSKRRERRRMSGSGKEVSSRTLSAKANGTEATSV